ncbi:MAG: 50S ribosomal protein L24 [Candidatus Omnitrophota bacterium]
MTLKIKKNDTVKVIAGKDKGKNGKVLKLFPESGRAIVEGISMHKKSMRKTQQNPQGGIISKEGTVKISNIMVICNRCNKPTRIGLSRLTDGTKARICKKCEESL